MEDEFENENGNGFSWVGVLFLGIIIGALLFGKSSKYEGMTAEEWFNDYDYTVACLQEIQNIANTNEDGSYKEINDALYQVSSEVDDCI